MSEYHHLTLHILIGCVSTLSLQWKMRNFMSKRRELSLKGKKSRCKERWAYTFGKTDVARRVLYVNGGHWSATMNASHACLLHLYWPGGSLRVSDLGFSSLQWPLHHVTISDYYTLCISNEKAHINCGWNAWCTRMVCYDSERLEHQAILTACPGSVRPASCCTPQCCWHGSAIHLNQQSSSAAHQTSSDLSCFDHCMRK